VRTTPLEPPRSRRARPNADDTSDFENPVGWLAQSMEQDKTRIGRLPRCPWPSM
jgi:hypothetical protein